MNSSSFKIKISSKYFGLIIYFLLFIAHLGLFTQIITSLIYATGNSNSTTKNFFQFAYLIGILESVLTFIINEKIYLGPNFGIIRGIFVALTSGLINTFLVFILVYLFALVIRKLKRLRQR